MSLDTIGIVGHKVTLVTNVFLLLGMHDLDVTFQAVFVEGFVVTLITHEWQGFIWVTPTNMIFEHFSFDVPIITKWTLF